MAMADTAGTARLHYPIMPEANRAIRFFTRWPPSHNNVATKARHSRVSNAG